MILKLKQNDTWRFIDNIQEVITPFNTIEPLNTLNLIKEHEDIFIQYWKNGEFLSQNVSQGCYILNDLGKTVEKIC